MDILNALIKLRDDIKTWVTNNLNALNAKIDEKTIPIDNELSSTSTNPVQNKAIKKAIDNIPKFSGDYNDLTNAPNIAEDGSGGMVIADEDGNIIFRADAEGSHTTALFLNGAPVATEDYVDEAISNIDLPESDESDNYYTKEETESAINAVKEELSESIVSNGNDWKLVDSNGNIIFSVDSNGAHTTSLTLNGIPIEDIIASKSGNELDKPFGTEYLGRLLYVNNDGLISPLVLGEGLSVINGVLTVTTSPAISMSVSENGEAKLVGLIISEDGDATLPNGLDDILSQSKRVTPTVSEQTVQPDEGYDYLSSVNIDSIPKTETTNSAGGTTVVIG